MRRDNDLNNRWWQEKSWKYGKLLLIWQESATDSGLWQLFLPGCGPKDLPEDHRFNPSKNSAELRQKVMTVNDFLDRDGIPAPPVPKKDIFCGRNRFSVFETRVLTHLIHIPAGKVISYGALANWAGYPRAARAVGRLMAKNPFPLFYPCHRVIRAGGQLGEYGGGTALKRQLLADEGIVFSKPQHIASTSFFETNINLPLS